MPPQKSLYRFSEYSSYLEIVGGHRKHTATVGPPLSRKTLSGVYLKLLVLFFTHKLKCVFWYFCLKVLQTKTHHLSLINHKNNHKLLTPFCGRHGGFVYGVPCICVCVVFMPLGIMRLFVSNPTFAINCCFVAVVG